MVNATSSVNWTELGVKPAENKKSKELDRDAFFQLLVAQLKNQDPLNPQDNSEFVAQLAQFSTVDGVRGIQNSMETLASSLHSNQALQASSLVGRSVYIPSDHAVVTEANKGVKGSVELSAPTQDVTLNITNSNGEVVRLVSLGNHPQGEFDFQWDGKNQNGESVPPGSYAWTLAGKQDGQVVSMRPLLAANVDSVTLNKEQGLALLNVQGVGSMNLDEVKRIS